MHKKHIFLRVFSKITIFACVFCAFFISPVFATLPTGYTELEYIESTGTQYIDTGYKAGYNDEFDSLSEMLSTKSVATGPYGARNSASAVWGNFNASGDINYTCFGDKINVTFSQNLIDGQFHSWKINNTGFYLDGTQKTDLSGSTPTVVSNNNVCVFGRYDGSGAVEPTRFWVGRIKTYTHKKDGIIVRNFIPAKRNSDSVIGMYDTVSGQFFTNAGTGTFVAGPVLPTPENPVEMISVGDRVVPAGYQELEYIESTSTQWIDTGVSGGNDNLKIHIKAQTIEATSQYVSLFANYIDESHNVTRLISAISPDKTICEINRTSGGSGGIANSLNELHEYWMYKKSDGKTYIVIDDGQEQVAMSASQGTENNTNIVLFSNRVNPSSSSGGKRFYFAEFYDGDTILRNFIPAKRLSDNEIGMYDTVSGQFFTNQGTGSFIAGPVVEIKIATTKMVDEEFAQAEANLATTVQTIESVVSRTITQTGQIATLHETKQTRPDENCPANMKCLLVQDEDGTPHWYPIIEP